MKVKIFKPSKNAMQSGRAKSSIWLLKYVSSKQKSVDPLMGWIGSDDTSKQVTLRFKFKEDAIAYAEKKGLEYNVVEPKIRSVIIKNYADNFLHKEN